MLLHINGEQRDFPDGLTVAALVAQLGMKPDRAAVELNLDIVPRAQWETTTLKNGDKLEVVHFVGGGNDSRLHPSEVEEEELPPDSAKYWICPTCSNQNSGRFCGRCGEKRLGSHDLSVAHLLSHAGESLFHWDSKILATFRMLLLRPGLLSAAYVEGRRKPYVQPFQVFFIANILYFLLFPILGWSGLKTPLGIYETMQSYSQWATRMATHRAAAKGLSMAEFGHRFDHVMDLQSRSLVLLMVPLFAFALFVIEWRKKRYLGEHLVFALHFMAVWLLIFMIALPGTCSELVRLLHPMGITFTNKALNQFLGLAGGLVLAVYLFFALRRFYGDSVIAALIKAPVLVYASFETLEIYRFVLFVIALYSA
jgi:thiamine biosynthesis protein ThiS